MPFLFTRVINVAGVFLYPAYASYKAINLRPAILPEHQAEVERWLMYWAVVGSWTAIEGAVGFLWSWLPFYTLIKTFIFVYLSLPTNTGAPYVYNTVLAPLFAEHEPKIDAFLNDIRGHLSGASTGVFGWVWEMVRKALGLTQAQAQGFSQAAASYAQQQQQAQPQIPGFPRPGGPVPQPNPPAPNQQAGGAAQQAYGFMSGLAGKYLPGAVTALAAAAGQAGQPGTGGAPGSRSVSGSSARGFDVPPSQPFGAAEGSSSSIAAGLTNTVQRAAGAALGARTPSDGSLPSSGSSNPSGSRLSMSAGYDEILREEAAGAVDAAQNLRRSSGGSGWMGWGSAAPKDKDGKKQ